MYAENIWNPPFIPKIPKFCIKMSLFERSTTLGMYNCCGIFYKFDVGILNILIFGRFLWVQNSKNVKISKNVDFGLPEIGQKSQFQNSYIVFLKHPTTIVHAKFQPTKYCRSLKYLIFYVIFGYFWDKWRFPTFSVQLASQKRR